MHQEQASLAAKVSPYFIHYRPISYVRVEGKLNTFVSSASITLSAAMSCFHELRKEIALNAIIKVRDDHLLCLYYNQ